MRGKVETIDAYIRMYRQTDRQTDRHLHTQTHKHTYTHTHTHTCLYIYKCKVATWETEMRGKDETIEVLNAVNAQLSSQKRQLASDVTVHMSSKLTYTLNLEPA